VGSNPTPSDFQVGHSEVSKETLDTSDEENTESLCGGMVDTCDLKSHASFRIPVQIRSEVFLEQLFLFFEKGQFQDT
jgi:hypothetical protein